MSSPNDNLSIKDGGDNPKSMRSKDVSAASDGSLQIIRHLATLYPVDFGIGGCYHTVIKSGSMAAGLAAAAPILSFRNSLTTVNAILRRIKFSAWSLGTGFTAGLATFDLFVARSFTASDTGGAAVTLTAPQAKLMSSMAGAGVTIRASTTATLTAGTRTLDTNPIESLNVAVGTATNTPFVGGVNGSPPAMFHEKRGSEHPVVLAQNEGFVIQATVPATGVWGWAAALEWDEVPPVNFGG